MSRARPEVPEARHPRWIDEHPVAAALLYIGGLVLTLLLIYGALLYDIDAHGFGID